MPSSPPMSPDADALREAVEAGLPAVIADLSTLVRIPSVSWDGFDPENVVASARAIVNLAEQSGVFDEVDLVQVPIAETGRLGHPAVLATRAARAGRPTILLYAHHDVQPPGDEDHWQSKPYEPTLRGDRLYGRGSADDKAGVMTHLAALRALTEVYGDALDLGIVLFVEGEEEFGSHSLPEILRRYAARLDADLMIIADSGNWDTETPALTMTLRGAVAFNLRVSTLDHASHSGMFGGAVPDAMMATIELLATLWRKDGSVAVEGLRALPERTPEYGEPQLREEAGLLDGVTPIGRGDILSRLWYQPSITVTGIDAPSIQNASNTLIPSLRVRISARIAPGQPADEAFAALEAHLLEHAPHGAHLSIEDLTLAEAVLVDSDWGAAEALDALHEAWGVEPVEMGVGGSIPLISDLVARFPDTQILITGVEDPDSRAHSPNESLHLPTLRRAILSEAFLLARLNSRQPARDGDAS